MLKTAPLCPAIMLALVVPLLFAHASDLAPNPEVWKTPPIRPEGFQFEVQISSLGTSYEYERVQQSIRAHNLGEYNSAISPTIAAEWGYSFTHLDGQTDGAGRAIKAGYPNPPASRAECLPIIEAFLQRQYIVGAPHPWASMNGHFPWHHYAAEFGFDQIGSEIGENINSYQWHIALTRGAARQYHLPWFIDFSAWHGPSINDYSAGKIWGENSAPHHGHSMSLFERSLFMSYMAGARQITAEAGGAIAFLDKQDAQGHYLLSPYGEVCKRFRDFSIRHPDIGLPYTPFAVLLDRFHGAYPGFGERKAFWHFPYTPGDNMTWELNNLIWPGGWEVMGKSEAGTIVNGPYGDGFDILLQNASQQVLNSYPHIILSGDIQLSSEETARLQHYVEQGGTLLLNTAFLPQFPAYANALNEAKTRTIAFGKGHILTFGPDYQISALAPLIRNALTAHLPISIEGGVQYLINLQPDALLITLINNDGVSKAPRENTLINPASSRTATIRCNAKNKLIAAEDILHGNPLTPTDTTSLTVEIAPGEIAILKLQLSTAT